MKGLVIAALALSLAGCEDGGEGEEKAPEKEQGPPPISETEANRGLEACAAYQDKVCELAKEDPSLEEDCGLADSRIEAIEVQLEALEEGGDAEQRAVVQTNIRRVYKRCLEGLAELEKR